MRLLADRGGLSRMVEDVSARLGAGADRRPPRHPRSGPQEPAPGRGGGREGVLGRGARRDGRSRTRATQSRHSTSWRARSSSVPPRTSAMEGEREFGFWHLLVRDVCYAQIPRAARADPPPRGCRLDGAKRRRAGRGPGRRARTPLPDCARARPCRRLALEAEELETTRNSLPRAGRRARARPRRRAARRRTWPGRSSSLRRDTQRERLCSSAGHRRHSSGAGSRKRRRRSRSAFALHREQDDASRRGRVLPDVARDRALVAGRPSSQAGDPARRSTLLEPQPPGPELVAAYAQLSGSHFISAATRRRSQRPSRRSSSHRSSACPSRPARSASAAACRAFLGERRGSRRPAPRARALDRAGPEP